ncbi:MAG: Helix-turn-helix domain [Chloroflexota bacterium]|jgi:transcriptional regulator with XRE-family HTH domain
MSTLAVATYIRVLRKARGLSQDQVAQESGLSERTITEFEGGRKTMHFRNIVALLDAVRGLPHHLHELALDPHASAQDAENLARALLDDEVGAEPPNVTARVPAHDTPMRALNTYARVLRDQSGVTAFVLSGAIAEMYYTLSEWGGEHLVQVSPRAQARIAMYIAALCDDCVELVAAPATPPDLGERLASRRSRFLRAARRGRRRALGAQGISALRASVLEQRLQVIESQLFDSDLDNSNSVPQAGA